jgi:hypothetical protein
MSRFLRAALARKTRTPASLTDRSRCAAIDDLVYAACVAFGVVNRVLLAAF